VKKIAKTSAYCHFPGREKAPGGLKSSRGPGSTCESGRFAGGKRRPDLSFAVASALILFGSSYAHSDEWEFTIAPLFLWGISIDGDATIGTATAPLDLNFEDDVLENLDAAFTVHFEARKDKLSLIAEIQYVSLDPTAAVGPVEVDVEFKSTAAELAAAWEFYRVGETGWEFLAGVRYLDQEVDVDGTLNLPEPPLGPGPLPVGISGGDDWTHPFIGLRSQWQMSSRWALLARGDYGYTGSDNQAINLSFMFDYRFRGWGSAFVGYRYMDFDYDNGSGADRYAYNAAQQGPLLGLAIHW
jgi:hypothetical protein